MIDMNCSEIKVMLVIMRKTFGWNRQRHTISLSQLADLCGMAKSTCGEAAQSLEDRGLIIRIANTADDGGISAYSYEIRFDDLPFERSDAASGNPVHPPSEIPDVIRNIENNSIEKIEELSVGSLPEEPFEEATPQDFRRLWEKHVGRLKQADRRYAMDTWADRSEPMSVSSLDGALSRFGRWLKNADGIRNPLAVFFLKNPLGWLQDAPEPVSGQRSPTGRVSAPPAAPDSQETELPALAVRWNATVTDAEPVVVWPPSQKEQSAFQSAITDPQFQPNVDKWLLKCQELRSKGGEKAACLNFVWACTNWRKIINGGCSWMVAKFDDKSRRVTLEDRNNAAAAEYLAKLAAEEAALNG